MAAFSSLSIIAPQDNKVSCSSKHKKEGVMVWINDSLWFIVSLESAFMVCIVKPISTACTFALKELRKLFNRNLYSTCKYS